MEAKQPAIQEFGYIDRAIQMSSDEPALNAHWQTVIFCVPVGHAELPLLHQAAKARQTELRDAAAKEKADAEKQLLTKDMSRADNEPRYSKR